MDIFKRLKLLISLFPKDGVYDKLLEIGYGSGIVIPELLTHCRRYYGMDILGELGLIKFLLFSCP